MKKFNEIVEEAGLPKWVDTPTREAVQAALDTGREIVKIHSSLYQTGLRIVSYETIRSPDQLWIRSSEHIEFRDRAEKIWPEGQSYPNGKTWVGAYW